MKRLENKIYFKIVWRLRKIKIFCAKIFLFEVKEGKYKGEYCRGEQKNMKKYIKTPLNQ